MAGVGGETSVIVEDIEAEDVAVLKARVGSDIVVEGESVSS